VNAPKVPVPAAPAAERPLRLTAVAAGLTVPSSTRLLADRLAEAVRRDLADDGRDVEVRVVELRDLAVDIANNLVAGFPSPRLAEATRLVAQADGLIAVTPVFAASYSGLFKSFFDVIEPGTLTGSPVLAAATGGTARHSLVLEHALRPLFAFLRAIVAPTAVYASAQDWGGAADPLSDSLHERVARAAGELADLMRGRADRPRMAVADEEAVSGAVATSGPGTQSGDARPLAFIPFEQQLAELKK
jgi:FMN reductase